jgi:hypothetical protein
MSDIIEPAPVLDIFLARTMPRSQRGVALLVHKEAPQYAKMVEKAKRPDTDTREYRHYPEGIWVTRLWLGTR